MFEQLEYLVDHFSHSNTCPRECEDCLRFHQAQYWLLLPFMANKDRVKAAGTT